MFKNNTYATLASDPMYASFLVFKGSTKGY